MRRFLWSTALVFQIAAIVAFSAGRVQADETCETLLPPPLHDHPADANDQAASQDIHHVSDFLPLRRFCNDIKAKLDIHSYTSVPTLHDVTLTTSGDPGRTGSSTLDSGAPKLTIDLGGAHVGGGAVSRLLSHRGKQGRVPWPSIEIGNGVIEGRVEFRNQDVPRSVLLKNVSLRPLSASVCDFSDTALSFMSAHARGPFRIQNKPDWKICGIIYASDSQFDGDLQIKGTSWPEKSESGPLILKRSKFLGAVRIINIRIKQAKYEDKDDKTVERFMEISQSAATIVNIDGSVFDAALDFRKNNLWHLNIESTIFNKRVSIDYNTFGGEGRLGTLDINKSRFCGKTIRQGNQPSKPHEDNPLRKDIGKEAALQIVSNVVGGPLTLSIIEANTEAAIDVRDNVVSSSSQIWLPEDSSENGPGKLRLNNSNFASQLHLRKARPVSSTQRTRSHGEPDEDMLPIVLRRSDVKDPKWEQVAERNGWTAGPEEKVSPQCENVSAKVQLSTEIDLRNATIGTLIWDLWLPLTKVPDGEHDKACFKKLGFFPQAFAWKGAGLTYSHWRTDYYPPEAAPQTTTPSTSSIQLFSLWLVALAELGDADECNWFLRWIDGLEKKDSGTLYAASNWLKQAGELSDAKTLLQDANNKIYSAWYWQPVHLLTGSGAYPFMAFAAMLLLWIAMTAFYYIYSYSCLMPEDREGKIAHSVSWYKFCDFIMTRLGYSSRLPKGHRLQEQGESKGPGLSDSASRPTYWHQERETSEHSLPDGADQRRADEEMEKYESHVPGFLQYEISRNPKDFSLWHYSLDVSMPIINLSAFTSFYPRKFRWVPVAHHLIGWFLTSVFIGALTFFR